jgi:hypothetical protein
MTKSDIPPDILASFMRFAADAYDQGKALQQEYLEGRKNLPHAPAATQIPPVMATSKSPSS